ncbi:unnamed protein product [Brassicogethes aeneus]|uniref:Integrase catalytic domain-containing protein n=1 Tax=Brassicogethes aeneus TaxID=1431903 RepID=A0A9P0FHH3_BRAAE|nr:unnamed protein product [Brassicogethes aeneus]
MPHITVADEEKLKLFNLYESGRELEIGFRSWEMFEYPLLQKTQQHTWSVKSATQLEKPRYIIVAFQTDRKNDFNKNNGYFDNISLHNFRLFLNSNMWPYDQLLLNFDKNQYSLLYEMYSNFQQSYFEKENEPLLSPQEFLKMAPIVVIDCSRQNDILNSGTVDIRELLRTLDPDGVRLRQRRRLRRRQYYNKGPNFLWHTDCYYKLKPFGICITGCIDGFSRYIIWLKAGPNTNGPSVIAYHFMQTVTIKGGCPQTLRADLGTENVIIERIQTNLKLERPDALSHLPGFLYGTSHANQRIEAWWSTLRKHHSQFWLNVFHTLKDEGSFSGGLMDKSLIQFCFLDIIKEELDTVVLEWNTHRIARSRNSIAPYGRPFMMYNRPQDFMSTDYLHPVSIEMTELWLETIQDSLQIMTCTSWLQ